MAFFYLILIIVPFYVFYKHISASDPEEQSSTDGTKRYEPAQQKLKSLYQSKRYARLPAIPDENVAADILNRYSTSSSAIVPKNYMDIISFNPKLIRGDIILLWWLDNPRTKKPFPKYFVFQYGIDPENELDNLLSNGLIKIDRVTLTDKGKEILNQNKRLIAEHKSPKSIDGNGNIEYLIPDQPVKNNSRFRSSGDFIKDQITGREYERAKDYTNALKAYESAFRLSLKEPIEPVVPPNIFMREAIIYRKLKQYDKEIETIKRAVKYGTASTSTTTNKLESRLPRAQELLNKQKSKKNK